mmetsp:Transcript_90291/g.184131  ORF Transcript_90291/g.184131 Transcript_90291/m.184131 type:complete len:265 (+) Transcript_90291:1510-2304(+)
MVGRPSSTSLDNETRVHTETLIDEPVVNSSDGQKWRNVCGFIELRLVLGDIAKNQDLRSGLDLCYSFVTKSIERGLEPGRSGGHIVTRGQGDLLETTILVLGEFGNAIHLGAVEDRRFQVDETSSFFGDLVDTFLLTQSHTKRHDNTFTKRIDGRVGHLSKTLLEVVVKGVWAFGKNGNRRIISHGVSRFLGGSGHVLDLHTDIFESPSERSLCEGGGFVVVHAFVDSGCFLDILSLSLDPFSVRMTLRDFTLDCNIVLEFTGN